MLLNGAYRNRNRRKSETIISAWKLLFGNRKKNSISHIKQALDNHSIGTELSGRSYKLVRISKLLSDLDVTKKTN